MSKCEGHVIDKAVWHLQSGEQDRTCGLELTFQNGATVLLGRKGDETGYTASTPWPVKKIQYSRQDTDLGSGKCLDIRYRGEGGKWHEHYLFNPLDVAFGDQTKDIPAGYEWVGYSLTLDSEGFIVWANPLLWPTGTAILK